MSCYRKLVKNLQHDVYCRIKPDNFGGVGVFAIKDIPKGVNPFKVSGSNCIKFKTIDVPEDVINKLDPQVKKMVEAFYAFDSESGMYGIPYPGLNANDISFYMNESKKPNICVVNLKNCPMLGFKTLKKISKGKQLFIDYSEYD
jgi:hypothetical protein